MEAERESAGEIVSETNTAGWDSGPVAEIEKSGKASASGPGRGRANGASKATANGAGKPSANGAGAAGANGSGKAGSNGADEPGAAGLGKASANGSGKPGVAGLGKASANGSGKASANGSGKAGANGSGKAGPNAGKAGAGEAGKARATGHDATTAGPDASEICASEMDASCASEIDVRETEPSEAEQCEAGSKKKGAALYKKLPHGPHGMDRSAVARNQRVRMYGAMIESVADKGYAKTSVADVISLAGVSRRAFYEHFTNKTSCFVATHDVVARRTNKALLRGWESERGWENRLHAACRSMLEDVSEHPKSAHLVMVDILGAGRKAYDCIRSSNALFERSLVTALVLSPDGAMCSPVAPRAIVGGVRQVLRSRIEASKRNRIPALTDELLDWIGSCRSPAVERLRKLPSPPALAKEQAALPPRFLRGDEKRAIAMRAFVDLAIEHGYEELTDPQIAHRAGLTTEAFHKQFRTKEHCYLAVIDEFCSELHEVVLRSASRGTCWTEGVRMGMRGYIEHIARHPAVSRLAFVELFGLGPAAAGRQTAVTEAFTKFLVGTGAHPARAPMVTVEALTGALWAVVGSSASSGRLRYLPSTLDHLTFTVLAPYTGPRPAIEAIEEAHARASGGLKEPEVPVPAASDTSPA